ncbi:hypothetical protein CsatA_002423 [Cannabis sativa]
MEEDVVDSELSVWEFVDLEENGNDDNGQNEVEDNNGSGFESSPLEQDHHPIEKETKQKTIMNNKINVDKKPPCSKIIFKKKLLKMRCASFYIPKQSKLEFKPLGDDAHFVSRDEQTIGVADGVGGWDKNGIDSGKYARSLIVNSSTNVNNKLLSEIIDPKTIIREAFSKNSNLEGSSTMCVVTHNNGMLRGANIGDSGFLVFREGKLIYKSPTQQKRFNCPFQLGNHKRSDGPECAVEMELGVKKGDVVVMGSDGLLDNLFDWEIQDIIKTELKLDDHDDKYNNKYKDLAFAIAGAAYYRSLDRYGVCPYTIASAEAGRKHKGGKMDDISVIIGHIVCNWDMLVSSSSSSASS